MTYPAKRVVIEIGINCFKENQDEQLEGLTMCRCYVPCLADYSGDAPAFSLIAQTIGSKGSPMFVIRYLAR